MNQSCPSVVHGQHQCSNSAMPAPHRCSTNVALECQSSSSVSGRSTTAVPMQYECITIVPEWHQIGATLARW